jgi:hypothetical protein
LHIGFSSAELQDVIDHYDQLEARFGSKLAETIMNRMAVLDGANHLGLIPTTPPIALQMIDRSSVRFSVRLGGSHSLLFYAIPRRRPPVDLAAIQEIEIFDIR